MKVVYYAHSLHIYNTPQEQRDVKALESMGFEVLNPNQEIHQRKYQASGYDFKYFLDLVRYKCDGVAFRAYMDGSIPAGVASEVKHGQGHGKFILELPRLLEERSLSIDATRQRLREEGQR